MKFYHLPYLLLFLVGCSEKIKKVRIEDNLYAKGRSVTDSMFDGEVFYYDKTDILLRKANFKKNILDGPSLIYYSNGVIKDSIFYINDLATGFHYIYDEKGNVGYIDYNYLNLGVGPQIFFKQTLPDYYSFSNFEHRLVFYANYDSNKLKKWSGKILNFNYYHAVETIDNENKIGLFLYLINPPLLNIKYYLGIINLKNTTQKDILVINSDNRVFIDTLLQPLNTGSEYYIRADCLDLTSKTKVSYFQTIRDSIAKIY